MKGMKGTKGVRASGREGVSLVTGASGGIGLEIARRLAGRGDRMVITARSEPALNDVAKELKSIGAPEVVVIPKDLGTREGMMGLVSELRRRSIVVHTLINNAGFGWSGPFFEQDPGKQLHMIELNVSALTYLTRELVPDMVKAGSGEVMNVASVAGFQPGPYMATYYATKAYVVSLSEALREELRGTGVRVVTLCPGPTHTGFARTAGMEHPAMFKGVVMEVGPVVDQAMRALGRGGIVIPGLSNKLLVQAQRLVPRSVPIRISRGLNKGRTRPA